MAEDLYDEFGNYIGPDLDSDGTDSLNEFHSSQRVDSTNNETTGVTNAPDLKDEPVESATEVLSSSIVLHEDKKLFLSSDEVYPDAEVIMQDEDAQSLDDPIIAPIEDKTFLAQQTDIPFEPSYSNEFLMNLSKRKESIRNIAVLGHLHHGKTTLCDLLINSTLLQSWEEKNPRWLDTRQDEQDRGMSIKAVPASLVLPNRVGRSSLFNIIDTPGHPNFSGEVSASLRLVDGIVMVVDVIEGVQLSTRLLLKHAIEACLQHKYDSSRIQFGVCLVINKVDRLVTELKLPPEDAFAKINYVISQMNIEIRNVIDGLDRAINFKFSPKLNNICFASASDGWIFSLDTIADLYRDRYGLEVDLDVFSKNLWGNVMYNEGTRTFVKHGKTGKLPFERSFVHFVLNPIYKVYACVISESPRQLKLLLRDMGIKFNISELKIDVKPLVRLVMSKVFPGVHAFTEMVLASVASPIKCLSRSLKATYSGDPKDIQNVLNIPQEQNVVIVNVVKHMTHKLASKKFFVTNDNNTGNQFLSLGIVLHGVLREGSEVVLLGEKYQTGFDEEDQVTCKLKKLYLSLGRHRVSVSHVFSGNWALIEGLDSHISKTGTIYDKKTWGRLPGLGNLKPLKFNQKAVVKIAVEPLLPNELPQLVEALRCVTKSYILCKTKIEESGEHAIVGTGELFLDSAMRDMREMYTDIEIRVADPCVSLRETVLETSALKCFASSMNEKNKITMIAEPLENGLPGEIEKSNLQKTYFSKESKTKRRITKYLQEAYEWDILAARSIWAFGPESLYGTSNVLLNDILPNESNSYALLETIKQPVVQGFQWATREGPLCDEPIRGVKFRLLDVELGTRSIDRSFGQIIPTTRRSLYSSFMTAVPKLMEPINFIEAMCTADVLPNVENVLNSRRGNIIKTEAVPGSPFFLVKGRIPVMDSFGFETDLRIHTRGLAFVLQIFDHWNTVPGDPLDDSIVLRPLEAARPVELAREFMIKTRRRKGLGEQVTTRKYFDKDMIQKVEESEELRAILR